MKNTLLNKIILYLAGFALVLSPVVVGANSALSVSCVGVPSNGSITWTASSSGGVAPVAYLWGNTSTSTVQTISVAPGLYSMNLQATDASSTVATTSCTATVAQSAPTISSFTANPSTITSGQSSTLSWSVGNASSTSINNGLGIVTGTSISVSPTVTTTYQLSAISPVGTTNASVTVTVNTAGGNSAQQAQIQAILNQIAGLRSQLAQLLGQQGTVASTTPSGVPLPTGACFQFNRDLHRGDNGDDVKELQKSLAKDPSIFTGSTTGFFGPQTENALKKYQLKYGIFSMGSTTTGYFGVKSRGHLQNLCTRNESTNLPSVKLNNGGHGEGNKKDK